MKIARITKIAGIARIGFPLLDSCHLGIFNFGNYAILAILAIRVPAKFLSNAQ
jgi:hypothetical protein